MSLEIHLFSRTSIHQTKMRVLWKPSLLLSVQRIDSSAFKIKWGQQILRENKRRKVFLSVGSVEWKYQLLCKGLTTSYSFSLCQQIITLGKRHSKKYGTMQKMEDSWFLCLYNPSPEFINFLINKPPYHLLSQFIFLISLIFTTPSLPCLSLHYLNTSQLLYCLSVLPQGPPPHSPPNFQIVFLKHNTNLKNKKETGRLAPHENTSRTFHSTMYSFIYSFT